VPRAKPLRIAAVSAAVLTAYAAGAVTMALAHHDAPARHGSVIDEAEQRIAAQSVRPVSSADLERAAVEGMLAALDDRWSAYYAPTDFARFEQVLSGSYSGVGVWVHRAGDGTLRILSVQADSPAAHAGLKPRDILVQVAGDPVAGRSVAAVVGQLRGDVGSAVTVQVRRETTVLTMRLQRAAVSDDDVTATMVSPTVERLRVAAFTRGVGRWVRDQVAKARTRHLTGLILDLRDDPGGLMTEAVETASAFLDGGPVVAYA
jgi:carboxyl-terminal processing protease